MSTLASLYASLWSLAAVTIAAERGLLGAGPRADLARRSGLAPETAAAIFELLDHHELARPEVARELDDLRSTLGQIAALVARARDRDAPIEGWQADDPVIVEAQAGVSEAVTERLTGFFARLEGVETRLSAPGGAVLDVGAGGAGACVALARRWPLARVVGIEPAPHAVEVGRRRVAEAGLADRVELRQVGIEAIDDVEAFDLTYVAQMFIPEEPLVRGLPAVLRALRPGGWLVTAATCLPGDDLASVVSRLRTAVWGGGRRMAADVVRIVEDSGFSGVTIGPSMPGATVVPVLARKG